MPKNCCVPLCTSNARKNPGLSCHEFPSSAERRQAWLTNTSRQASGGKETRWVPSDHSLVCSLHFTGNDKKGTKLQMLLPTAIPTVFPNYPSYMQKPSAQRNLMWPLMCGILLLQLQLTYPWQVTREGPFRDTIFLAVITHLFTNLSTMLTAPLCTTHPVLAWPSMI